MRHPTTAALVQLGIRHMSPRNYPSYACLAYSRTRVRMRTVIRTRMLTGVEKLSLLCTVCNSAGTLVLLQYLHFITAAAALALQANIAALCLATRSDTRHRCAALQMSAVCNLKQTRNPPTGTQIRKPRCCSFNVSSRLINSDRLGTKLYL
jgi:hypothetical protein